MLLNVRYTPIMIGSREIGHYGKNIFKIVFYEVEEIELVLTNTISLLAFYL